MNVNKRVRDTLFQQRKPTQESLISQTLHREILLTPRSGIQVAPGTEMNTGGKPMTKQTPWAILLCKWNDMPNEPKPVAFFEKLFTATGRGTNNMVDFFDDVSHGNIDISGSQVFGWITLTQNRSDYQGSGANPAGRQQLIDWAKQAVNDAQIKLERFFNVVVCMSATPTVGTDLFGGVSGVVCDTNVLQPSVLGQEMGHGYDLDHSRRNGSTVDYTDMWDVMSTWNSCWMTPHKEYTLIGPGLNAANMSGRGWLDESRVWQTTNKSVNTVIRLRPLFRRDLPGFLAARLGEYFVEFRNKESWDAAIPRPAVLIHRFEDNHSYLMSGTGGEEDLVKGSVFEPDPLLAALETVKIEVIEISPAEEFAEIRLVHNLGRDFSAGPGILFGGVSRGGDGFVIVGKTIVRIPPRSPLFKIIEQITAYEASDSIASVQIRNEVRRQTLSTIAAFAQNEIEAMHVFTEPVPLQRR